MKRHLLLLAFAVLALASCSKEGTEPTTLKVEIESVTGSRARFTIAPEDKKAYYTYTYVNANESSFNDSPVDICLREIEHMEDNYPYFQYGSFTDVYCYRGSRQLTISSLVDDLDFRLIVFQIDPETHSLLGDPVVVPFHTKPVPQRDLHFDVSFSGDTLTIVPSDATLPYLWTYENTELITENYFFPASYIYSLASMYIEYGFIESECSMGTVRYNFADEIRELQDGELYTFIASGCEEGEFTTGLYVLTFRYHPHNIEVVEIDDGTLVDR